ncbi:MAG: hypothetical protein EOO90_11840 [Pedobacter sp.]|nr:MAG: hypothetical protein EOO90_11840 [Pedobacter sp.]
MLQFRFFSVLILCVSLFACSSPESNRLSIDFSRDSSAIEISNIESAALLQIKNNITSDSAYQKLVSVLEIPGDSDTAGVEREFYGKLTVVNNQMVFIPNIAFVKGRDYLVETIINTQFASVGDVVGANVGQQLKREFKTLKR